MGKSKSSKGWCKVERFRDNILNKWRRLTHSFYFSIEHCTINIHFVTSQLWRAPFYLIWKWFSSGLWSLIRYLELINTLNELLTIAFPFLRMSPCLTSLWFFHIPQHITIVRSTKRGHDSVHLCNCHITSINFHDGRISKGMISYCFNWLLHGFWLRLHLFRTKTFSKNSSLSLAYFLSGWKT